jgi:hypothetical protein
VSAHVQGYEEPKIKFSGTQKTILAKCKYKVPQLLRRFSRFNIFPGKKDLVI